MVADGHGPSSSTVCRVVHRVTAAILRVFSDVVRWPEGAMLDEQKREFHALAGLPDVVGK